MDIDDFEEIMEKGFGITHTSGTQSELICHDCHERTEVKSSGWFIKTTEVVCQNEHSYSLIDYLTAHTNYRDNLLLRHFEYTACYNYPPKPKLP